MSYQNIFPNNKRKEPTTTQPDVKRARAPGEKRFTAYLGRVPPNVNESVIRYIFSTCGNIMEIRWQQDKINGAFKGNGWIEFDTEAALNKALAQDGVVIEGQSITVARAVSKDPQYEPNSTIHIKNLPLEMSDAEIRSLFQHIGAPKAVRLSKDSGGGFGGRAWVEFDDAHTATLALSLNLASVRGHVIEISFAKPKTGGPTPGGGGSRQPNPNMMYTNPNLIGFNNYAMANYATPAGYVIDYNYAFAQPGAFPAGAYQPNPNYNQFPQ